MSGVSSGAFAGSNRPIAPIASHASVAPSANRDVSALPDTPSCTVDPERELFVIDLSVVRDCFRTTWTGLCPPPVLPATRGAWTVGGLLPGIFGTNDPLTLSNRTKQWLGEWKVTKTVNGDTVPARPNIQSLVITPWETASGGTTLDMTKAPFRLQAIVFRIDLRKSSGYSGGGTAGEGRFVFTVLNSSGNDTLFNVILEYGLDAPTCSDILAWAQRVHALSANPFSPEYNAALQSVTDLFTTIGASPNKLNDSAINQVRSNEIALAGPWELREFRLKAVKEPVPVEAASATTPGTKVGGKKVAPLAIASAALLMSTVAQTPADEHNFQQIFADFVNANIPAILNGTYVVPLTFNNVPFRGGASENGIDHWDGPPPNCSTINDDTARHIVSLNTCDGCHGAESGAFDFRQVTPHGANAEATLSTFLTGNQVTDVCGLLHTFNDIERRRVDLCQLLQKTCLQVDSEAPTSAIH